MAAFDDWSSSGGMAGDLGGSGWAPNPPPQLAAAEGEADAAEVEELGDESSDEEEERPRFELEQVAWEKEVPSGATVKRLAVGNGVGLLVTDSPGRVEQVWVWELVKGGKKVPVEVPALEEQDVEVAFASICPIGCHAFISLSNGEVYYLNIKTADSSATSLKAKGPIKRLKGVVLASLAWDTQNTSTGKTGDVLLGTTVGTIWHVALESSNFMDKKFVNQVYQLGLSISICGLELVRVPGRTKSWFAMAATAKPTRLYEFSGGPTIEAMFERYAGPENLSFRELPGTLASCELRTFLSQGSSSSSFMLISEVGLYVGLLQPDSRDKSRLVSEQHRIVVLPSKTMTSGEALEACPRSAAETSHHYVLAYCSWLVVVSKLNEEVVHEERFNQHLSGNLIGLTLDQHNGSMWVLSENEIALFKAENEEGQLWRVLLDQAITNNDPEKFSEALAFCQTDSQKDKVLTMRADFHFKKGEYKEAATLYAQTKRSFEEISLMLIDNTKREALRVYLTLKLEHTSVRLKTQRTIIAVWLVELWLKEISDNEAGMYNVTTLDETSKGSKETDTTLQDDFHAFLAKSWSLLSPAKDTVYQLIDGHGRDEDYIIFALCNGDFDRVVVRYIHRNLHDKAISVLAQQALRWTAAGAEPPLGFIELYYKYSPELMEHCPTLTVDAWIDAAQVLDPCKLIPALVRYSQIRERKTVSSIPLEEDDQAVRYLEHCVHVQGNTDQAVHNLLLSLYAKRSDDGNLRDFVRSPNPSYDLKYALRVCTQAHQSRACVDIYSAMGLYAEAVRLALDLDPELARANAEFVKDESTRKKMWLLIAEHEIKAASRQAKGLNKDSSQDDVVKRALEILHETDALTVEDILEFLPDFVAIGDLKDEICQSLHRFSVDIDTLKEEIGDLTENAESLRAEISAQEDQFTIVRGGHGCDLCGKKLDKKALYVFPCTHTFHTSCLLDEVARHVGEGQLQRINEMRMLLNEEEHESYGENVASNRLALSGEEGRSEDLKRSNLAAVDDFLAAACPFCGELMIQSIAEPFVTTRGIHGEEDDDWAI